MKRLFLAKHMVLVGLVALPLVGVNAAVNFDRSHFPENPQSNPEVPGSTELCDGFPLTPDTGWQPCVFDTEGDIDTFTLELEAEGCLRLTDAFIAGDNMTATRTQNGKSFTTSAFAGPALSPTGLSVCELAWESSEHVKGQGGLKAGSHTIEVAVTDDNVGVFPAGYCIRFDTESPACRALQSDKLRTDKLTIITNQGNDRADVLFPDGSTAAENVAPGVSVMFGTE